MFQKLVSHNDDLRRLVEKGYAVGFDSNCLVVRDLPYLDAGGSLQIGAIVAKLEFVDETKVKPTDHQVYFAGSFPHGLDGQPIRNLGGGKATLPLSNACDDVVVQRSFSHKPKPDGVWSEYSDFFEKIETYVAVICGPAMEKCGADPLTFRVRKDVVTDTIFKFHDTLTTRAEISDLTAKFREDVIAIIGLGGTGAYVLDFIVKTPVKEIRGFDRDPYHVHNAFRSPGKLDAAELGKAKPEVFQGRYENFRNGLHLHSKFIDRSCADDLRGVTFCFVCVDKGSSRSSIIDLLLEMKIPFIDVGMGLKRKDGTLTGMLRMTYFSESDGPAMREKGLVSLTNPQDDIYRSNVQIAELNALNASLAVVKFKQLRGFYAQDIPYSHLLFGMRDLKTTGE